MISAPHCISIYISTEQGKLEGNKIALKNHLKKVRNELEAYGLKADQITARTKDIEDLFDDLAFWQKLSNGLAVLVHEGQLEIFVSDRSFTSRVYVANHLHLLGLINELDRRNDFYLLVLGVRKVRFFKGNESSIDQLELTNVPNNMEEVVGTDVRQKSLQFRSGQGEAGSGMFHGHGSGGETEKKVELTKYFNAIDHGLSEELDPSMEIPLIVASEERAFYLYKEANSYPFMEEEPLQGNHQETGASELHKICLKWMNSHQTDMFANSKKQFGSLLSRGESSSETSKVIRAAYHGQIATLFIKQDAELFGYFRPRTNEVSIQDKSSVASVDLLNFAAIQTILNGGRVLIASKEDMPDATSPLNAIFRYEVIATPTT